MLGWSIIARAWRSASNRAIDLLGVHARLDDLQRDLAAHGLRLLGHVDDAHAALADLLHQLVGADDWTRPARASRDSIADRRRCQESARAIMRVDQCLDLPPQLGVGRSRPGPG